MRLCGFKWKETEIPCFYDVSTKKELRTQTGTATKATNNHNKFWTRTHPCGSDEKHDGNLLLNEFPSIILKIKSSLLSESNDHPSNEPLKVVNTKRGYSESNQDHYFWDFTVFII